jgi:hypothetical protein
LKAVIDLPTDLDDKDNLQIIQGLIDMIYEMADTIATMRIPQGTLDKCTKSRAKFRQERKEKNSAANEDRARAQKQLEAQKLKNMTPEEQAKYEEKKNKTEQKRKMKSLVKVQKQ